MDDRVTQAWLNAAHQEFHDQEKWRLAEMRAYWRMAEAENWKDRFIAAARAARKES